ncbi:MAG: hypothetical protein QOE58_1336, partial [Actinomycetota bacterium]|nr:hypothetical protein [Actinomycetota bacterium]
MASALRLNRQGRRPRWGLYAFVLLLVVPVAEIAL